MSSALYTSKQIPWPSTPSLPWASSSSLPLPFYGHPAERCFSFAFLPLQGPLAASQRAPTCASASWTHPRCGPPFRASSRTRRWRRYFPGVTPSCRSSTGLSWSTVTTMLCWRFELPGKHGEASSTVEGSPMDYTGARFPHAFPESFFCMFFSNISCTARRSFGHRCRFDIVASGPSTPAWDEVRA